MCMTAPEEFLVGQDAEVEDRDSDDLDPLQAQANECYFITKMFKNKKFKNRLYHFYGLDTKCIPQKKAHLGGYWI